MPRILRHIHHQRMCDILALDLHSPPAFSAERLKQQIFLCSRRLKKSERTFERGKGEDWNIVSANVLIVQMSDPFQAGVFGAAWIGICKSLLTIENSINSALSLPLRVLHPRAGMLDGASGKHTSRGIPFYLLRLCGRLYREMLGTWRAQKLFLW